MDDGPYSIMLTLRSSERSHDVDLLSLREVEDFFGSGAYHFVILANRQKGIVAVHISIRQHHWWIVFIHDLPRDLTD